VRPADCVRQRRQPAARAHGGAHPRTAHPVGAGRVAMAARAERADRESAAVAGRNRAGSSGRVLDGRRHAHGPAGGRPASQLGGRRRAHSRRRRAGGDRVWSVDRPRTSPSI
jgi:hypothetical protein